MSKYKHETNYYTKIAKAKQQPAILADRKCKCGSELGAIHPDTIWCIDPNCNYGELHIVGNGTRGLNFKSNIKTSIKNWAIKNL